MTTKHIKRVVLGFMAVLLVASPGCGSDTAPKPQKPQMNAPAPEPPKTPEGKQATTSAI